MLCVHPQNIHNNIYANETTGKYSIHTFIPLQLRKVLFSVSLCISKRETKQQSKYNGMSNNKSLASYLNVLLIVQLLIYLQNYKTFSQQCL